MGKKRGLIVFFAAIFLSFLTSVFAVSACEVSAWGLETEGSIAPNTAYLIWWYGSPDMEQVWVSYRTCIIMFWRRW